jgi:V/A-type H+/Na+-transporting ATPase subunit E
VNQVQELERAILARAQQLADQFAEQGRRARDSILREANDQLRAREQREEAAAKAAGDRHYRQRVQAEELKLQRQLDQVRWNLVRAVEDRLRDRFAALVADETAYLEHLRALLREGAQEIGVPAFTVRANAADLERLQRVWPAIEAELAGLSARLDPEPIPTLGGLLLLGEGGRVRVDNRFEGRLERLRPLLQRAILEHLLPTAAEPANPITG